MVLLRSTGGLQRGTEDRTRDELRLMGIRVDEVNDPRNDTAVEQIVAERGALGAIRFDAANGIYEAVTWFPDSARGGELTAQRLSGLPEASNLAALRMAETVRHRVLEMQAAWDPPHPDGTASDPVDELRVVEADLIPPPPVLAESSPDRPASTTDISRPAWRTPPDELESTAPPSAPRPRTQAPARAQRERWLGVSVAVAGGPGGVRSLLGAALTFGWRVVSVLTLQGELGALVSPVAVPVSLGSVHVGLASAQVLCALGLPGDRRVMPRLRIGGGPVLAWATGRGTRPEDDGADLGVAAVVTAGAGLAIRVRPRLHLSVGIDAHLFLPPVGARINEAPELRLGPPLIRGTMGLEWVLPGRRAPAKKI